MPVIWGDWGGRVTSLETPWATEEFKTSLSHVARKAHNSTLELVLVSHVGGPTFRIFPLCIVKRRLWVKCPYPQWSLLWRRLFWDQLVLQRLTPFPHPSCPYPLWKLTVTLGTRSLGLFLSATSDLCVDAWLLSPNLNIFPSPTCWISLGWNMGASNPQHFSQVILFVGNSFLS